MDIHSGHIGFPIALDHTQKFPAVALIEAGVVGHQIGRGNARLPQILHCHIQQFSGNALTAVAFLRIHGADIGGQIGPVVEVVFNHAQAANDFANLIGRFEKKIHDLELTRAISIQTAPQIRMIQNNDNVMVEKIQTTLMNTIPLWKNQMVLALGIAHSSEAAAAQKQVNDITNALLKQNAERLHLASVETAREAERGIVDIETLKETNAKLIQTFDDVMKIQADGRTKRLAAEAEMLKMENDLKQKLLQIRNG
mgnify:CR=1 FL=1